LISGSLFPEFMEIVAGVPFILSIPGSDEGEEFVWECFDDGTGIRILEHWDNFYDYSWLDTLQFDWYANDDSVTIIHIDDWYGEEHLDTLTLDYSVMDDTLYVSESIDPCGAYYYWYDNCDEYYDFVSMLLGIEDIQEILGEEILVLTNMNSLSMDKGHVLPPSVKLYQNYPNPFNPVTTLHYEIPEDAMVNITIYDMMGRVVSNLVSSQQNAGYKSIQWNATNNEGQPVSAGMYIYTIQAGEFGQAKKMVLLK